MIDYPDPKIIDPKSSHEIEIHSQTYRIDNHRYGFSLVNLTDHNLDIVVSPDSEDGTRQVGASSPVSREDQVGGIDLTPNRLNLQIKRDGNGVPLPINLQPLETMQIDGFLPVIINITPVLSLPLLAKVVAENPTRKTSNEDEYRPSPMAYLDVKRLNLN